MAISSRRGFRSILTRKTSTFYSHLKNEDDQPISSNPSTPSKAAHPFGKSVRKKTSFPESPQAVTVSVVKSEPTQSIEDQNSINNNDDSNPLPREEEKVEEEKTAEVNDTQTSSSSLDVFETTRNAAIELVKPVTDIMANTLASRSETTSPAAQDVHHHHYRLDQEEKTMDMGDTPVEQELHRKVLDAFRCGGKSGGSLLEQSQESIVMALDKTQKSTLGVIEASASKGEDWMSAAEASSQAAITDRLPISPLLEETSEKLEKAVELAVSELQEFLVDHWALLKDQIEAVTNQKSSSPSKPKKPAGNNATVNVSIEVQMKA